MATGMAGERDDRDVPAHLRVTDEIPVGMPWRREGVPPGDRSPEATPSTDTDASAGAGSASTADPSTEPEARSPADTSTESAASATADRPTATGASSSAARGAEAGASMAGDAPGLTGGWVPTGAPTPAGASTTADAATETGASMDRPDGAGASTGADAAIETGASMDRPDGTGASTGADAATETGASKDRPIETGAAASADPPPGPFLEADSPPVAGPSEVGPPVETGGSQAGATRPVPATDVQVHPVIPPPRPYAAPVTVEEGIPLPPAGPYRPVAPPVAGRRSPARALRVGVILAGAVLMGVGFLLVYGGFSGGAKHPAPCGGKPCAPPSVRHAAPAGAQIAYRTVERDAGYFEGTVTIANHGDQPMRSWTLSFRYPGADIHNTWDAVLQRRGEDAVLTGTATARPIAPGATLEVRFGGSGAPSTPTDCRLNGAPCAFIAR
jgi:hypothetical protein